MITTEFDPLRDEEETYAARLQAVGVPVLDACYAGTIHGFMAMASVLDKGKEGIRDVARWLRSTLS